MRAVTGHIYDTWVTGGPFIGANAKPCTRVTVEIGWTLGAYNAQVGTFKKPPLRYVQTEAQTQVETEIPNVQSVNIDRSIDQDAATINISLINQIHNAVGVANINSEEFGNPGALTWSRGSSAASNTLWGHTPNAWSNVLVPNALIRTYQGFGGHSKTIAQAVADGNIILTGVWLLDEVKPSTGGRLELVGRDLAKLLIDQPLYPPLVPLDDVNGCDVYPLRYARYKYVPGTQSQAIRYGASYFGEGAKKIRGIEFATSGNPCNPDMEGYWIVGSDGGVFSYGYVNFFGSLANTTLNLPVVGMTARATNNGYWLAAADGGVFAFGDAPFYGSLPGAVTVTDIVAIERSRNGNGYLLAGGNGGVYAFGDAAFQGSGVGVVVGTVVGFDVRQTGGEGYWLCTNTGHVYAFGSAGYYGGINGAFSDVVGFASTPTDNGYWLLRSDGAIYSYGDANYFGGANWTGPLNDPATDLAVSPNNNGYWIVAEDGGVFTFGNNMKFYGSLPGPFVNMAKVDGNYFDLTDIVKDLCRWAGFWIYDGGVDPTPFGTFESTGIVSNSHDDGALPESMFDKVPPIDAINQIKALVGYQFYVDEEGGAHFKTPNWWQPGNFLPSGTHTNIIPEINETVNLSSYGVLYGDKSMRSRIVIASDQPLLGTPGTVVTDYTSTNAAALKGLQKPFMWVNKVFINANEQRIMAELIDLHINMRRRLGSVTCVANPLLQLGDQVRIVERETSDTYIHYVRGISTSHDLVSGRYEMTLQTNWMGDSGAWSIFAPSVVAKPNTVSARASIPTTGSFVFSGTPKPSRVLATTAVPAVTIRLAQTIEVTTVAASAAVNDPSIPSTAKPAVVAVTVGIPTPSIGGESVVIVNAIGVVVSIPEPIASTGAEFGVNTVTVVVDVPDVITSTDHTCYPTEIAVITTIDTVVIEAGSSVDSPVVSAIGTVPGPSVSTVDGGSSTISPVTIAVTTTIPSVSIDSGAVATPSTVDAATTVPAPSLVMSADVGVTAIAVSTTVPAVVVVVDATISSTQIAVAASVPAPNISTGGGGGGFVMNLLLGNS